MTQTADLIVRAATIHTMNDRAPTARAIAVRDGVVIAVDTDTRRIDEYRGAATTILDLGDATLTPGLIDGHIHPVHGLSITAGADLTAVGTRDELITALRRTPVERGWVRGWGLDPNLFSGADITSEPLVEALGEQQPAYVVLFDAHSALASPAALRAAGIAGPREFASNATVVCDAAGVPTGHVLEFEAMNVVEAAIPVEARSARRARLLGLLQSMADAGLTAGNVMDFGGDSGELLSGLEDDCELPMRLRMAPWCEPGFGAEGLEHLVQLQRRGGRRWQVDGAKLFIDGTVEGGTAWLEHADSRGECVAPNWPDPAEYRAAVHYLAAHGVPTVTHAIGDAAVRYALATLAAAQRVGSGALHRIEHIESIPDDLVPEFGRLGIVASMQPTHCTHFTRADATDEWSVRLGPERVRHGFRTRDIRDSGGLLAIGSDWPVAPFDPRSIVAAAQLRRPAGDTDDQPRRAEQALTARMALEGYTTHAAVAQGNSGVAGVITPGARADFTAFTVDPLAASSDESADAPIVATLVAGRPTYLAGQLG